MPAPHSNVAEEYAKVAAPYARMKSEAASAAEPMQRYFHARLGDLVPNQVVRVRDKNVRALTKLFKMGFACLPLEVDPVWREHFTGQPVQMSSMGFGYGIVDGHHRYTALLEVYGPRHIVEVAAPRHFEGDLPAHPEQIEAEMLRQCGQAGNRLESPRPN